MEASEFSSVQFNKTLKAAKSQKFLNKLINTNNTTMQGLKCLDGRLMVFGHHSSISLKCTARVTPHKKGCITFEMPGMHEAIRDIKSK